MKLPFRGPFGEEEGDLPVAIPKGGFLPITIRRRELPGDEQFYECSLGEAQYAIMRKQVEHEVRNLLQGVLGVPQDSIRVARQYRTDEQILGSRSPLTESGTGCRIEFTVPETDSQMIRFEVDGIPCRPQSRHFEVFFESLQDVLSQFYSDMNEFWEFSVPDPPEAVKVIKITSEFRYASTKMMHRADWFLENLQRNVVTEYIFSLFNVMDANYEDYPAFAKAIIYEYDLISTAFRFAEELSTRSIEGNPIKCGFVFHQDEKHVRKNSANHLVLRNPLPFGSFKAIKPILETSDGQSMFFNVTKGMVTSLFVTREPVVEIQPDPQVTSGKTFSQRPLVVSVQGYGRVHVLEGREQYNTPILQLIHTQPRIVDHEYIRETIHCALQRFVDIQADDLNKFITWILRLSTRGHGTTLIFPDGQRQVEEGLMKSVAISKVHSKNWLGGNWKKAKIHMLTNLTNPDGALILDRRLDIKHIGAILRIDSEALEGIDSSGGGARHTSAMAFTKKYGGLALVVSEDGPISMIQDGEVKLKI